MALFTVNSFRTLLFSTGLSFALALLQPKAFINRSRAFPSVITGDVAIHTKSKALQMLSNDISTATSILLSDNTAAGAEADAGLQGLRIFFVAITALVFGFAALTYVAGVFIVPKAARQLEDDTKRLRPGLWEEYTAKLGEGETMANRPDLLQELGNVMQPVIIKDFEDSADAKKGVNGPKN